MVSTTINAAICNATTGWSVFNGINPAQIEPLIYLQYSSNKGKFYFRKNPANPPYAPALTVNGPSVSGNSNHKHLSKIGPVTYWGFDIDFRITERTKP